MIPRAKAFKKLIIMAKLLALLSFVSLPMFSACTCKKQETKKVWSSGVNPYFSIHYPECWREGKNVHLFDIPDRLDLFSSPDCPKSDQGSWHIGFMPPPDRPLPAGPKEREQEININGISAQFYDQIVFDSTAENIIWTVRFRCDGHLLSAEYSDHLDKSELEKAAKNHVVPEVFKKFVASFQCVDSEK